MEHERCPTCFTVGEFSDINGQIYCTVCGWMSPYQQRVVEYDAEMWRGGGRKAVTLRTSRLPPDKEGRLLKVPKDLVVQTYVTSLQRCLMEEVDNLKRLGVNSRVNGVMKKIWLRTVEVSRIMAPDSLTKGLKQFRNVSKRTMFSMDPALIETEARADEMYGSWTVSWTYTLWQMLDMEVVPWIVYAACVCLREAVTPVDICAWIHAGKLSYLNLGKIAQQVMHELKVLFPGSVMRPRCAPSPLEIAAGAGQLAEDIGLQLPPLNFPLLLFRMCDTLELPAGVCEKAVELHRFFVWGTLDEQEGARQLNRGQVTLVVVILVVLKFCYGLDGRRSDRYLKGVDPPPECWLEWADAIIEEKLQFHRNFRRKKEDIVDMSTREAEKFAEWCKDEMFPDFSAMRFYDGLQERLAEMCKSEVDSDDSSSPGTSRSSGSSTSSERPRQPWQREREADEAQSGEGCSRDVGEGRVKLSQDAVQFEIGDGFAYMPDLFLLPTNLYWFVPTIRSLRCDVHLPVDFSAVLGTLSLYIGSPPEFVLKVLRNYEASLVKFEFHLWRKEFGKPLTAFREFQQWSLKNALRFEGLRKQEREELLAWNEESLNKVKQGKEARSDNAQSADYQGSDAAMECTESEQDVDMEESTEQPAEPQKVEKQTRDLKDFRRFTEAALGSELDYDFVCNALSGFEHAVTHKRPKQSSGELKFAPLVDDQVEACEVGYGVELNAMEVFEQAKRARTLGQPFVTLDFGNKEPYSRHSINPSIPFSRQVGDYEELPEKYMSDVEVSSEPELESEEGELSTSEPESQIECVEVAASEPGPQIEHVELSASDPEPQIECVELSASESEPQIEHVQLSGSEPEPQVEHVELSGSEPEPQIEYVELSSSEPESQNEGGEASNPG